jgi:hypothetical protein
MAAAVSEAVASLRGRARAQAHGVQDAARAAWLCALPCAGLTAIAILLLGPPLGELLSPAHSSFVFLTVAATEVHPEPTEHARYLIALCAPLLGAVAISTAPRWLGRIPARAVTPAVVVGQLALGAVLVASLRAQYRRFVVLVGAGGYQVEARFFTPATLVVAALAAAGALAALRAPVVRSGGARLLRESRGRRVGAAAVAAAMTVVWVLPAVNSDASIGNAILEMRYHLEFTLDETFAVLNGRTPLVDFSAQYGSLSPYVIALPLLAFGKTLLTFTLALCAITALALLAVYDALRRAARSSLAALLLYLPFLATSLFLIAGTLTNRSSVGTYSGNFPLRYAPPFLLACLTAFLIERRRTGFTGLWTLFTLAGLAVLNNADFGLAALGGTLAALLWAAAPAAVSRWRATLPRVAGALAAGLASAFLLVSVLTLVRAGSLPQPARIVDYARIYTVGGFALMPIPGVLGMHLLIYLTYVAAIAVATVRAARNAANRVLTGMLAWSGVFGLGAGMYWVGRSHPIALKYHFAAWALALVFLAVCAVRELAAPRLRATAIGAVVVLFGVGVAACSLAQTPTPWGELARLHAPFVPTPERPSARPLAPVSDPRVRAFVAPRRGAPVAILLTTGHRIADAYGVVNVSPYTGTESLPTAERVEAVLDALRAAGGTTVILPIPLDTSIFPLLERRGFKLLTETGLRRYVDGKTEPIIRRWGRDRGIIKWVDVRGARATP